jgi:hypothetical protein
MEATTIVTMSPVALTTTFVPPSSCLTDIYLYTTFYGWHFYSLGPPDTNCFPSGWIPATTAYFSPGVCPKGYDIACLTYNSISTLTETIATCCPNGYACFGTQNPWFTGEACSSALTSTGYIVVTTTNSQGAGTTQVAVGTTDAFNAFGVIIRYQSIDSSSTMPLSSPTQQASITNPTASITNPQATISAIAPAASTSTSMPSSGISTGAEIGIGVGIGSGLLVIASFFFLRRLRRRAYSPNGNAAGYTSQPPHEMEGAGLAAESDPEPRSFAQLAELHSSAVYPGRVELEERWPGRAELAESTRPVRAELADSRG